MKVLLILSFLMLVASCSTGVRKSIESDRESIGVIQNEEEVINKMRSVLDKSKITKSQKNDFIEIYKSHRSEILAVEEEIREYRVVLFKTLVAKNYNQRKFDIVANKLKKLVVKRYDLAMEQYRKGKDILGVNAGTIYDDPWFEIMHKF